MNRNVFISFLSSLLQKRVKIQLIRPGFPEGHILPTDRRAKETNKPTQGPGPLHGTSAWSPSTAWKGGEKTSFIHSFSLSLTLSYIFLYDRKVREEQFCPPCSLFFTYWPDLYSFIVSILLQFSI